MTVRRGALLFVCLAVLPAACAPAAAPQRPRLQLADVLGGELAVGFERAMGPRRLTFPQDHGAHPEFQSEWWYATGNLRSEQRRFGYQLTFFRTALAPPRPIIEGSSRWRTSQVYMAHFALTDQTAGRFVAFDRLQRAALGLAGAHGSPWRVWLDDWSLEQSGPNPFPLRVRAAEGSGDNAALIDLILRPTKPMVLQGEQGFSRKGPSPGSASYYYSFTRLQTSGTVVVGTEAHEVEGNSWLDREWSTSVLEPGQVGWDWFAVQLSDGTDLMFYRLRRDDTDDPSESAGTLVGADGTSRALPGNAFELRERGIWRSPIDGTRYPSGWTLAVPELDIELTIDPVLENQELDLAFRYWEGAVSVSGRGVGGAPITGSGYVELTGYAEAGRRP